MVEFRNLSRFIPNATTDGLYNGLRFGTLEVEGSPTKLVGAALGPFAKENAVQSEEDLAGALAIGALIVKSKTVNGTSVPTRFRTRKRDGLQECLATSASFRIIGEETRIVPLEEDNVRYLEVWSGEWGGNEMHIRQLLQDGELSAHGAVAFNGGEEVTAAKRKPVATEVPVGFVGKMDGTIVWRVAMWRMPFTKEYGSELIIRSRGRQFLAVARPDKILIEPADTDIYRQHYDDLIEFQNS